MIDWRTWLYEVLTTDPTLATLVPAEQIHGAGSLTKPPAKKPFIIINFGALISGAFPGLDLQNVTLWVHDEPGSYQRITAALAAIRASLAPDGGRQGRVVGVPGAIAARWQGDSADINDEGLRTIARNTTYQLSGVMPS